MLFLSQVAPCLVALLKLYGGRGWYTRRSRYIFIFTLRIYPNWQTFDVLKCIFTNLHIRRGANLPERHNSLTVNDV